MKDLLLEIKKQSKNRFERSIVIAPNLLASNGKLSLFVLLQEMEKSIDAPFKVLQSVAQQYHKQTDNVQIQLFEMPIENDLLQIEGRFYHKSKKEITLKLFARVHRHGRKSKKVAVAKYHFKAIHQNHFSAA